MRAPGGQERFVNPGETVVYGVLAALAPTAPATELQLSLSGPGSQWARILGPAQATVQPGESWNVSIAVAVPASATPTEPIDLVVRAGAANDPNLRALVRLYGTITTEEDLPDEAELAARIEGAGDVASPAPVLPLLGFVLLALALLRRR